MPKLDSKAYDEASAMTGEFKKMGAGGYVCAIQAVRTSGKDSYGRVIDYVNDKEYVKLIFDVIEGEFAGNYSTDYWTGEDKDFGHQFFLSWKNYGALKNVLQSLDESNPGFDSRAAFEADKWELFIGKKIGLVFGEEEYRGNDGSVKTRLTLPRAKSVQDIHDGKYRVPAKKTLDGGSESTQAAAAGQGEQVPASVYDDVPF